MNTTESDLVNWVRPEAKAAQPDLQLVDDLLAGTRRIQEKAQDRGYLRRWDGEDPKVYTIRTTCETVFEGMGRVLSACTGMLFAKPPALEWNASETAMVEQWQNLDGKGTAGPVFAKRFADQALRDGIGLILVDHTPAPEGVVVTQENEQRLGLRPTWAMYQRKQAISWVTAVVNNATTLVQVVLAETATVRDGRYGVKAVKRYRVLALGAFVDKNKQPTGESGAAWELWEETTETGAGGFKRVGGGVFRNRKGAPLDHLPLRIAYAGRTDAPLCATLPLLGVAWANLAHWQISTDLRFAEMVAAYAQPVTTGAFLPDPLTGLPGKLGLGPLRAVCLVEGGSFEWKAPPVEAFASLERAITTKERQIGSMGLSFMVSDTRAAETAQAKMLDSTAENSTLATAEQGIEDALNGALEDHAWYLGIEKAGAPVVTLNKDFGATVMDAATMIAWATVAEKLSIPLMVVLEALQQGGRIKADADLEAIAAETLANQAAIADQKAQAQADSLALMTAKQGGAPNAPPKGATPPALAPFAAKNEAAAA